MKILLNNCTNLNDNSNNIKEKKREKKVRFKFQLPPREPDISCIKKSKQLNSSVINYFASILMHQPENSLNLHNLEFMPKRYDTTELELRERWHSVAKYSVILDSDFLDKITNQKSKVDYEKLDIALLNMIDMHKKLTIRHVLIPYFVSNTWILIWIEYYSFEIQILSPKVLKLSILEEFTPKLTDYIKNSKWFENNFDYIQNILKLSCDINNIVVQQIDCTLQFENYDSGVLICYYMFAKYQGIIPINIELFSKKRREILFRSIRKKDLSFLAKLFYSDPQTKLAKQL